MKRSSKPWRLWHVWALLGAVLSLSSGCVPNTEYLRMQRALGAEIIELRQGKKRNAAEYKAMRKEVADLKLKLKGKDVKYAKLDARFKAALKDQKKLDAKIKSLLSAEKLRSAEVAKCGAMLKGKGKKLFDLQTALAKKEQELRDKEAQFTAKQEEFKKKNDALLADIKKKQDALKTTLARVQKLEKQINALRAVYTELTKRLRSLVQAGKLKIRMDRGLLVLQMPEKILFSSGRANVKRDGRDTIGKVTQILKTLKYRWQVTGHTDSRGSANFNWRLSTRRALAVLFVMLKNGMPTTQVSVAGFGQYQPNAANDTSENRALNRRTELILLPDLSDLYPSLQQPSK